MLHTDIIILDCGQGGFNIQVWLRSKFDRTFRKCEVLSKEVLAGSAKQEIGKEVLAVSNRVWNVCNVSTTCLLFSVNT